MTASVITFSSQVGSGGGVIARAVAEKLRFRYYDWEIISRAAQEAGVSPEVLAVATSGRTPSFLERVMSRLAGAGAGEETAPAGAAPRPNLLTSEDYRQFLEHVVRELGTRGDAVILNHAGQVVLRDVPGVLKVLLHGSQERRAARLASLQNSAVEEARKTVAYSDDQRIDYFKKVYHIDWLNCRHYDVALNTDYVSQELAGDIVVAAARELP